MRAGSTPASASASRTCSLVSQRRILSVEAVSDPPHDAAHQRENRSSQGLVPVDRPGRGQPEGLVEVHPRRQATDAHLRGPVGLVTVALGHQGLGVIAHAREELLDAGEVRALLPQPGRGLGRGEVLPGDLGGVRVDVTKLPLELEAASEGPAQGLAGPVVGPAVGLDAHVLSPAHPALRFRLRPTTR